MRFHFSGLCGAGMGNVAMLLKSLGHEVKGSDQKAFPPMSTMLKAEGIEIFEGYSESNVTASYEPDVQVIANALSRDNPECALARSSNWQMVSFPEVIEKWILPDRESYVVAGTHGKTTTSSILAQMLEPLGAGSLIGGIMQNGNPGCRLGEPKGPFVLEGDEYDTAWFDKHSKFLHYRPKYLILTHLEWDHVDIFPEFEMMLQEFRALLKLVPPEGCVLYCGDVPALVELMKDFQGKAKSYGFAAHCDWRCLGYERQGLWTELKIQNGVEITSLKTQLFGKLYVLNLLAAFAMASETTQLSVETIQRQIENFAGAKRRMELLRTRDFLLFSDFAHHPTAIKATLVALREEYPDRKIVAIFDPRNATSRRNVFETEMASAFECADRVLIAPPHLDMRLDPSIKLNAESLANKIGVKAKGYHEVENFVEDALHAIVPDGIVVVMSCGNCYDVIPKIESL